MVKLETFLLETDVGETIIVCVAIDTNASTYFPVELHLTITLQFLATGTQPFILHWSRSHEQYVDIILLLQ